MPPIKSNVLNYTCFHTEDKTMADICVRLRGAPKEEFVNHSVTQVLHGARLRLLVRLQHEVTSFPLKAAPHASTHRSKSTNSKDRTKTKQKGCPGPTLPFHADATRGEHGAYLVLSRVLVHATTDTLSSFLLEPRQPRRGAFKETLTHKQ